MAAVEAPRVARALYDSLVQLLESQGASNQLNDVIAEFVELVQGSGPREAEVTSATQLSQEQQDQILQQLRSKYGSGLAIKFVIDAAILGGLIIRVGDQVLDDSVRSRLAEVQQRMLAG
ncbi:MAG: hypothetical protein NVS4B8_18860 [Herpetosiphon sp.]